VQGNGLTGKVGDGPACRFLKSEVIRLTTESNIQIRKWEKDKIIHQVAAEQQKSYDDSLRSKEITIINRRIAELDSLRKVRTAQQEALFSTSILAQTQILAEISNQPGVAIMKWLIIFLFIMLESAPILVKFMSPSGAYEEALDTLLRNRQKDLMEERNDNNRNFWKSNK
jgi:hypothetical protein